MTERDEARRVELCARKRLGPSWTFHSPRGPINRQKSRVRLFARGSTSRLHWTMSDDFLDNAGLARLLGVSTRTITDLCHRGIIVRRGKTFDRDEAVRRVVAHLRAAAAGRGQASGGAVAVSERARLAAAQADAQEMKNRVARRELVPEAEVEGTWTEIVLRTRAAVLATPAQISAELPHLTRHDVSVVDRKLRDALTALGSSK